MEVSGEKAAEIRRAIGEILGLNENGDAEGMGCLGVRSDRFVVLWCTAATAPLVWDKMEAAGWQFVANVGSGVPMFRKTGVP